jgi:hypothetical protein
MQLIKAKVSGYKRLADNCQLNLDTDPVCIVGPNAAGKSSFLDALVHLNHNEPFEQTEMTRVPGGGTLTPSIEARFLLSEEDRTLLKDIPEAANVRQFIVSKRADSDGRRYKGDPYPERDLSKRHEVQELMEKLGEIEWSQRAQKVEEELDDSPDPLVGQLFDAALDFVKSDSQALDDRVSELSAIADRVEFIRDQKQARDSHEEGAENSGIPAWPDLASGTNDLPGELRTLASLEKEEHPNRRVLTILASRVPQFIKFDENARRLEAEYDLSGDEPEPETAVHNFLALAGSSWAQAVEVVQRGDKGWKKTYLDDLDRKLRERAALVWRQSDVEVKVDLDGSLLTILLSMQARDFIDLEQHSDGLQQFMSLRAFVWGNEQEIKPIILIDEADLHLHYDAQADLVGVFEEQQEAHKIIYTTHSAGCLPRDLGFGIRAIVPETEEVDGEAVQKDHSRAVDRFWTEGRGLSPLLMAMGAGAFAFSATQWAVVTEGMSDVLLLPTLMREATDEKVLRYQAVGSFAEARGDEIDGFDQLAGRVAFLADGDKAGRRHLENLVNIGVLEEQILLMGGESSGLSIEDLLEETVYLNAVNKELGAWHGVEFPASELPKIGRSKKVEEWCAEQNGRNGKPIKLSKVDVAQKVLDQRSDGKVLLAEHHKETLRSLHREIMKVFEDAPARVKRLRDEARQNRGDRQAGETQAV